MRRTILSLCLGLGLAQPAAALGVAWMGHLEDDAGPVNGPVSATFTVTDADGAIVETVTESSLLVDGGDFVVELDVPAAAGLSLSIVVNGVALEPAAPLPLDWPRAAVAAAADVADDADAADRVGAITTPLSNADLATAGRAEVPLARVVGFPAAFLDGDQGLDFTPAATIAFSNGTIGLRAGSLPGTALGPAPQGADLAANTITTADLANGTVGAADLGNLPLTRVADGTLTARNFGTSIVPIFEVTQAGCSEGLRTITTASTCSFTSTSACVGGFLNCLGQCVQFAQSQCPNSPVGALVFP